MIISKRTNSDDKDFQTLVRELDFELKIRDGDEHLFYAQLNKTDRLDHVIVVYDREEAIGCGAIREYAENSMEIKRMFVPAKKRRQGIATAILKELEIWCREMNCKKCMLETGKNQPEAIQLYEKNQFKLIPNFGKYIDSKNSVCFEKELVPDA